MSAEEKRRFEKVMMSMSHDITPLSKRDELSLRRIERDLERRAFDRLNPTRKSGMSYGGLALFVGWWIFLAVAFYAVSATAIDLARYVWTLL